MKRLLGLPVLMLLWTSGCAAVSSNPERVIETQFVGICPAVPVYSPAFQIQLADELKGLPEAAGLWTAMMDYGALRAALRTC